VRCPVAQLLTYPKSGGVPRLAREFDQYLRGGHCFGSSRTRRIERGKITSTWATQFLTVEYDVACSLNVSVRMAREYPSAPCRAGEKKLYDSPRLHVVEIAHVA